MWLSKFRSSAKRDTTDAELKEIFESISNVLSELIKVSKTTAEQIQLLADRLTILEDVKPVNNVVNISNLGSTPIKNMSTINKVP